MDQLTPQHVPVYETSEQRERLWDRCTENERPVVAIRDGRRGCIVHYDLQPVGVKLETDAVRILRDRTRSWQSYPAELDPVSETEGVGGEAGPVSGAIHTDNKADARVLASRLSAVVFDESNWQ